MSDFPCFIVNLEKDKERRIAIEDRLHCLKLPHVVFPAIYGKAISPKELAVVYDEKKARKRRREVALSEIGCALSHYAIYQEIVRQQLPYALILEDDVMLADETPALLKELARVLNPDEPTVVLLTFARRYFTSPAVSLTKTHSLFNVYGHAVGAYAYCVTQRAAQNLMDIIFPVSHPMDIWGEFSDEKAIDLKAVVPYCAAHNEAFASNIVSEREAANSKAGFRFRWKKRLLQWSRIVFSVFRPVKKQQKTW